MRRKSQPKIHPEACLDVHCTRRLGSHPNNDEMVLLCLACSSPARYRFKNSKHSKLARNMEYNTSTHPPGKEYFLSGPAVETI
jgi:hypothetical protein